MPQKSFKATLEEFTERETSHLAADGPIPEPPAEPFRRWGLKRETGLIQATRHHHTKEEVRALFWERIDSYLQENSMNALILAGPPGVGKTHIGVHLAQREARKGRHVLYLGPRHDFYQDIMGIEGIRPAFWQHWLARQLADEFGRPETCRHAPKIERWIQRGYDAMAFCRNAKICGWDYIKNSCPWHRQTRERAPIVFGQHQHLAGMPGLEDFDLIIGDELPLEAIKRHWQIPARYVAPPDMDLTEPFTELIHQLSSLCQREVKADGPDLLQLLGGPEEVWLRCSDYNEPLDRKALAPNLRSADEVDEAPYFHLPTLGHLLWKEADAAVSGRTYPPRVAIANGMLHLLLRRYVDSRLQDKPIIWLDGTANQHIYEAVFNPRPVEVVMPSVAHQGKIYQVWQRGNGKGTLLKEEQPTERAAQLKLQIEQIIKRGEYKNPALISFKDLLDYFALPGANFSAIGTNRFENCDCLIVAGTPQPALDDLYRDARMLWQDRMTAFDTTWTQQDRVYRVDENGIGESYPVSGHWNDTDLSALLWQQREAKLIQAAHRARPLLKPVDIWLLSNIPLQDLEPDALLTVQQLFQAPKGVSPWLWPAILAFAEEMEAERGYVTSVDLAQKFGCTKTTAGKYIDIIAEIHKEDGWGDIEAIGRGRGRPPKAVGRYNAVRNKSTDM